VREEVYGDMQPLSLSSLLSRRETAWRPLTPIHVRNGAAMALAATSGATDAIGYLTLGHVFTSAMTGNLVLLGISLGHHNGERAGRVLVSLVCFMFGAAFGARIARSPKQDDPVWPPAVTAALAIEVPIFIAYAACWWAVGARPDLRRQSRLARPGCDSPWHPEQHDATIRARDSTRRFCRGR
jgi:hypothetical protein